ncbi:MAG: trigger factor [Bryobacteraceae bacterium]
MSASCKQTLEITVPADEVEQETQRILQEIGARAVLPGFRPGKVPASILRARFAAEIREELIRALVPKYFQKEAENRNLNVVGSPNIRDVQLAAGQPMTFWAEFEVAPEIELKEYEGITVPYREPKVTEEEVEQRLEQIREQKAEFVNLEPRPAADGDYVVLSLEPLPGQVDLGKQEELVVRIGDPDTLPEFSENLRGASPGEEREFEVRYPQDYGNERLAGRTVRFRAAVKGLRRKELPELNDAFAADLGDYRSLEELKEELRKSIQLEQEFRAQQEAKNRLIDALVDLHDFPVPEALLERQIENQARGYLQAMAARGADPRKLRLDWEAFKERYREQAVRDVKASLLLDRIAEREAIEVTNEELERELQRMARLERQPVAALRQRLQQERALGRVVSRIRMEKTLNFLFERARKVAQH